MLTKGPSKRYLELCARGNCNKIILFSAEIEIKFQNDEKKESSYIQHIPFETTATWQEVLKIKEEAYNLFKNKLLELEYKSTSKK